MTSLFDPDAFLDDEQGELSTERTLIPIGNHNAFIESLSPASGTSESGKEWARLDIKWSITEPSVLEEMQRAEVYLTQGCMLTFDEATGKLSTKKGDNYQLGQVRAAVGKPKGSVNDLIGSQAVLDVRHRVYEGKPQEYVKAVASV